ncbi:signal transduction histidine kinase [Ruegeria lacuscaerulensis ITI-1157]|nr:signal transduction histidine kinase [Ruegeria lacuscaerulensis ITI-1157]SHJ00856.1 Two-component sensor histidine kinase, contains HisKA and HATPase domains [Ruegeria lacuscaerulensis ITI-1157]
MDAKPRSLTVYLAALVTLALLPLGLIAVLQTRAVIAEADERSRASVLARTIEAASRERELLQKAVGASSGLTAALAEGSLDNAACSDLMRRFVERQPEFVFAGFIQPNGIMACSTVERAIDLSDAPGFGQISENPQLTFSVNRAGAATGQSVIIVTQPVLNRTELLGFVSISIPHALARTHLDVGNIGSDVVIALFDATGEVLSSNVGLDEVQQFLPPAQEHLLVLSSSGKTFSAKTVGGEDRVFAVATIIPGEVAVIGSWPREAALASVGAGSTALTIAFPILMWVTGLGVALWGLHRLVIRHLDSLRSAVRRFALGERDPIDSLEGAPQEFQQIQTAFNRMVLLIREAEAQHERDLIEKTLLLREVHHRVKNNLQLIASIMNMHLRKAETPEARRLLEQLQRRVRGLAMVHQTLNQNSQMTTINTEALIGHLVAELAHRPPILGQVVEVDCRIAPVELGQDQAVTLSMLVAEALTNAVKYVGVPQDGPPTISVELTRPEENTLHLKISNTRGQTDDGADLFHSGGIGQRLMQAFLRQLDGSETITETSSHYVYEVTFEIVEIEGDSEPQTIADERGGDARAAAE